MTPRVVWVTNIPAPYRWPVYEELAQRVELTVRHLTDNELGRDWLLPETRFDNGFLRTKRIGTSAEHGLYALVERAGRVVANADVVVLSGWESPAIWQLLFAAKRQGIPTVAFYESTGETARFRSGPVAAARRWFFRSVDSLLTPGVAATTNLHALGVRPERIVTAFNPVDVELFAGASKRRTSGAGHRFVYVGQLIDRKNVATALAAFAEMRSAADTFTVVGDGPLRSELELGATQGVTFRGHVKGDALVDVYADADTLVLPSMTEVWGLVVNEALAAGLHAVVSTRCGVVASVEHMRGVFVAEPSKPALAAAMAASRAAWTGPISDPEIRRFGPSAFVDCAVEAISLAQGSKTANIKR